MKLSMVKCNLCWVWQ